MISYRNIVSRKVNLGGSKLTRTTFWIVDQSSAKFFRRTRKEAFSITIFPIFDIFDLFRIYSRSNVCDCVNRPKFCTFWPPIFMGRAPWTFRLHYKIQPIILQSFTANAEILWRNNKKIQKEKTYRAKLTFRKAYGWMLTGCALTHRRRNWSGWALGISLRSSTWCTFSWCPQVCLHCQPCATLASL